jgi:tRNA(Ile)-lysidine synthase
MDGQLEQFWGSLVKRRGDLVTLDRKGLACVHPALQRHLVRACLEQLPGGLKDIESAHVEGVLDMLGKPAGRRMDLPHGLVFITGYDNYLLGKEADLPNPYPELAGEYILNTPGTTDLPGWRVDAAFVSSFSRAGDDPLTGYIDFDSTGKPLSVRPWKNGDRFHPLGLGSEKKLGEFMIDARVPRAWRRRIPVVISPAGITWLVGYRMDERFSVGAATRKILKLSFRLVTAR